MATCQHKFEHCVTPPASGRQWYRCSKCLAFAWKRRGSFKVYKCTEPGTGCKKDATDRLPGLGGRSYKWRCDDHGSRAEHDTQSS